MAEEIEVKAINIDRKAVEAKLRALGAEKVFDGNVHNVRYDYKDKSLEKSDSLLRLRREGDAFYVTYKRLVTQKKAKVMAEIETEVGDFESMDGIVKALGLVPVEEYDKGRVSYELNDFHFDIDEYDKIPAFMEIEGPDIDAVYDMASKLGIPEKNIKTWNTQELFNFYKVPRRFRI